MRTATSYRWCWCWIEARMVRLVYRGMPGLEPDGLGERGIDPLCPVWSALDLLPAGRGDWYPAANYSFETHF
jgi:hypothetical protein